MARRRRGAAAGTRREYPRTARVGELLREIVGEELEAIGDERLEGVVVTSVDIDRDLRVGVVYWDSRWGEDADDEILEALGEHRVRLQRSINRQAHLRRTPELTFRPDPGVREGSHVESLLATIEIAPDDDELDSDDDAGPEAAVGDGDDGQEP